MTEERIEYISAGILPHQKIVEVQGHRIVVDPLKFGVESEILIREAFQDEMDVFDGDETGWKKAIQSRKIVLAAGQAVIPLVCTDWTPERVAKEMSHETIGGLLNFFLRSDWRQTTLVVADDQAQSKALPQTTKTQETQTSEGSVKIRPPRK